MARTVRDSRLETRAARDRLALGKVQWKTITPKLLHLGYKRKRKNETGQWVVRHYLGLDGDGVGRYSTTTIGPADDHADADGQSILSYAQAQKIALEMNPSARRVGALTVAEAMSDYVAWLKAHRTIGKRVEQRVAMYIAAKLGNTRVADLTTDQIQKWHEAIAESPAPLRTARGMPQNYRAAITKDQKRARKSTANLMLAILKAGLSRAWQAGLVEDNKAWARVKPFSKVIKARARFLTVGEAQRLLNAADESSGFRNLLHAALLTGCRYGELGRFCVEDFQNKKLHIRESKSGKARWVRLTEEGVSFFESLTVGRAKNTLMLPHRIASGNYREWRESEQREPMEEACSRAKIEPITFHGLRHTWASLAVMAGVPLMVVADNLGHANTRMVEAHYGHLTQSYMDDAIMAGAPRFGAVEKTNVRALRK
jgi:integrase